jgi:hypothetical protein
MRNGLILTLAAAALFTPHARAAEQARNVAPFSTVSYSGPISVHIEVGKAQSITVSGSDELVGGVLAEVAGNELKLHMRHDTPTFNSHHDSLHVTITMPQITAFTMGGAGDTTITHIRGDRLDARFGGAGSLKADGAVKNLVLNVGGVGSLTYYGDPKTVNTNGGGGGPGSISKGK